MEMQLKGVHLSDDMIVDSDDTMVLIDYKFNRFIIKENVWEIGVDVKNRDSDTIYDYKVNNQEHLQERVYKLLIKVSGVDGVLRKINV
ncbi:hypothetical protein [Rasiella sp. SM2506]|uniref:hypothetical protein n=1 Tax=Rasiella sp. SM2506 TaxID=3423914 RepID=UPI003D79EE4B